jgi:hypothetical protein
MKYDFLTTSKDKLAVTVGGFRGPTLDPFNFATVPGYPDLCRTNNYFLNGNYTRTISPNLVNEFRAFTQRNYHTQDFVGAQLPPTRISASTSARTIRPVRLICGLTAACW